MYILCLIPVPRRFTESDTPASRGDGARKGPPGVESVGHFPLRP